MRRQPILTPQATYVALLAVRALHLLHHRLAKRHISFAEVVSALVLGARSRHGCSWARTSP